MKGRAVIVRPVERTHRWRDREIRRIAARLAAGGWPRAEITLLVALTGLAGLLASFLLLAFGLESMALRYPLAVAIAYAVFLLLVRAWLRRRRNGSDWLDPFGPADGSVHRPGGSPGWEGDGGSFGGGGASGSFGDGGADPSGVADGASALGDAADVDEGVIVLLPLALLALGAFGAVWVVWTAPVLFAELLLDAALATGLYRRLRRLDPGGAWLSIAVRRTWLPVLGLIVVLAVAGFTMERTVPGARSIGEFARGV